MSTLFVTVGSTQFNQLISQVLDESLMILISRLRFKKLIVQVGNSTVPNFERTHGLDIEIYKYKPSIIEDAQKASLVISHAGAGTCLEMLRLNKRLLIVVNDSLMDNHQLELATQLEDSAFAVKTSLQNMLKKVEQICKGDIKIRTFPQPTKEFGDIFDEHLRIINSN